MSAKTNLLTRGKKQKALALLQARRLPEAKSVFEQVCRADPRDAEAWFFCGAVSHETGALTEAETCYRRAIGLQPERWDAHYFLGNIYLTMEKFQEAGDCYRRAIRIKPDHIEAHSNLGAAMERLGEYQSAVQSYGEALRLAPDRAELHYNLGTALFKLGRLNEAEKHFRHAIKLKPDFAQAYNNLGNILTTTGGEPAEELECYLRAAKLKPDYYEAHINLASMLNEQGLLEQAVECCEQALSINQDSIEAHIKLAVNLADQGRIDDAIAFYKKALEIDPGHPQVRSQYIFILNYSSQYDAAAIYAQHRQWGERLAHSTPPTSHVNARDPGKRLRIGYVSPDFRAHSVAYFIEPVLKHHDRVRFEICCYADIDRPDTTTARLQAYSPCWRNIKGLTNEQVHDLVRDDGIDILVDLAGHTANNRLLVFSRKPAPIQVTYLGYPNTTGLPAVDYRITDIWADPPGEEAFHTETLLRLPHGFLCYLPRPDAPRVRPLPALQTGHVTFGSFNAMRKITPEVIGLWSRILRALPKSRLVLKNKSLRDGKTRERCLHHFARHNIDPSRLDLMEIRQAAIDHLAIYNEVDIALDTFPYNGTTTTCEAIWMGVPVVTLEGNRHVGRVGVSLLNQVGLTDLIGKTPEEYVRIAVGLANDLDKLATLRSSLRERMAGSSLCDGATFTRGLEMAYRNMWSKWCATGYGDDTAQVPPL